jgi:hypothetical protein
LDEAEDGWNPGVTGVAESRMAKERLSHSCD